MANEIEKRNEAFLIYQDENGIARVNVRFEGEDVWLLQEQIMELFDASRQDVSYHINQIYAENEQDPERTRKNFLIVRQEGKRSVKRNMYHYNLDMIIAVGYRVKSQVATRFRQWLCRAAHNNGPQVYCVNMPFVVMYWTGNEWRTERSWMRTTLNTC